MTASPAKNSSEVHSCPVFPTGADPLRVGTGSPTLRIVTVREYCLPGAWNDSWNGALNNRRAASAVSAMTCVICAASALGARGRTSHNPPVVGSSPTRPTMRELLGVKLGEGLGVPRAAVDVLIGKATSLDLPLPQAVRSDRVA
jgi:hypothetical protein